MRNTDDNIDKAVKKFEQLLLIMKRLRTDCPWDKKQTHASLCRYIIEEAHESVDKIDHADWQGLAEELGAVFNKSVHERIPMFVDVSCLFMMTKTMHVIMLYGDNAYNSVVLAC